MIPNTTLYRFLLLCTLAAAALPAAAQELIPFRYRSEDDNKLLTENDSLRYYAAIGDTGAAVAINEELLTYKLVNRRNKKKVIAEGGIVAEGEGYVQHGRCVLYYNNGKVRTSGMYLKGKPAGAWEEFYPDGRRHLSYHYAVLADKDGTYTCMSGEYNEYYQDGAIKASGLYLADRRRTTDTQTVEDPVTGDKKKSTFSKSVYVPRKIGTWEYYNDAGEVEKKEEQ
ncbi:hypothetical protein GCM10023093_18310 [Nemorincola caseinilytica]|uniref:MORN repeat variant n=1 Tax=Nemorincola caseinilytica TaxID=2054315 RepID=A0ABP8NDX3_9BACT